MIDGVMLLWFLLTTIAVAFVAIDIISTPESPVLKWGFILLTAYTGPVGAFLYVLGCREPLPGLHERYVAVRWRQVLGSTMHCVAGDGIGILVGAVISSILSLHGIGEVLLEYLLGFAFGWTVFQALFMRAAAGGSYARSLSNTFVPELLSMNLLMAGMVPTMMQLMKSDFVSEAGPATPQFWFVMSMSLVVGFIVAYPMNWWLVANHMKHGMMTVRRADAKEPSPAHGHAGHDVKGIAPHVVQTGTAASGMDEGRRATVPSVPVMTLLSFLALAGGAVIAWL
ncbi:MAG: DUF4396 domain-containing protein [Devosia sp.]|jgi:hypothetical protein